MAFTHLSLWEIRLGEEKRLTPRIYLVLWVRLWAECCREIIVNWVGLI